MHGIRLEAGKHITSDTADGSKTTERNIVCKQRYTFRVLRKDYNENKDNAKWPVRTISWKLLVDIPVISADPAGHEMYILGGLTCEKENYFVCNFFLFSCVSD